MEETIQMSMKELKAYSAMEGVKKKQMTLNEASRLLNKSYRQVRRIYKNYCEKGAAGLVHRSRGRPSNHRISENIRNKSLEIYEERMQGFGPTFAAEKLSELGIEVNHETLRLWLIKAGIWERARKRSEHRSWREPKHHFGEMVQMDGSFHDWFRNGKKCCLMVMVDDATNTTYSQFYEEETTAAAMECYGDGLSGMGYRALFILTGKEFT